MDRKRLLAATAALLLGAATHGQGILGGHVTGNVELDGQVCAADSAIGAEEVPERLRLNARATILYTNGNFSAGVRFDLYQNPLLGFDARYKGQGIANYFAAYNTERIAVTAGHIYEQFGSGMIFRTYEDYNLGLDNALLGIALRLTPLDGVTLKALIGRQRLFWDYGDGLVRGVDGEVDLGQLIKPLGESPFRATLGASFVSRYQDDETVPAAADPQQRLNLPLNVGAAALRATLGVKGWSLQAEYVSKGQDPNALNGYVYHPGQALLLDLNYSQRGFSAGILAKRIDNMGFKSVRSQDGEMLYINHLPAITKNHSYAFLAMYPYATQVGGEEGLQADVMYKFKKGTLLGGQYGTDIHLNGSFVAALDTTVTGGAGTEGYTVNGGIGETLYGDISVEISKKISKSLKATATYAYQVFNPAAEGHLGHPLVHNHVAVADFSWKINKKHALRLEAEWMESDSRYDADDELQADRRFGDWLMALVEWSIGSRWFLSASDQYAYHDGTGNYFNLAVGYSEGATRLSIGYGKQREGLLCIGGVCRQVPASNGLTFSLTTSF
ncbi:MAG: hypothetical protein IJ745_01555 [Bacteroidales bacterium]|nr:hypothetical protein [Bacteroidales bacterium]